jgi:ribosome recycling factor
MEGAIAAFKSDIASLRTGRASANVLDPVMVEAYGSRVPLNQVANVTVPEPRMLGVSVWDKQMVGAVDRGIREANLGLNPIVDGQNLRIPLPELNEERRKRWSRCPTPMPRTPASPFATSAAMAWIR